MPTCSASQLACTRQSTGPREGRRSWACWQPVRRQAGLPTPNRPLQRWPSLERPGEIGPCESLRRIRALPRLTRRTMRNISSSLPRSSGRRQSKKSFGRASLPRTHESPSPCDLRRSIVQPIENFRHLGSQESVMSTETATESSNGKRHKPERLPKRHVYLVASGDLRLSANQKCWPAQQEMEEALTKAVEAEGYKVVRAHAFCEKAGHGFIASQREGMRIFSHLDPAAPLIVAECVWQYSHHVLPGLTTHRGPILTVANWSGTWPGLVGMLNLNGSMTKAGIEYSTIWSENFTDTFFKNGLQQWLDEGVVTRDESHVRDFESTDIPPADAKIDHEIAQETRKSKAIMGVFDEGCMGMFNAIIPDHLLNPTGLFKERLSQSTLYAAMQNVSDADARGVLNWLLKKGLKFDWGKDEQTQLTKNQTLLQCKMYIAALRIADEFGCATIGIQYQQGLKDLAPASDLVEGLLNNVDRPPV